MLKGSAADGPAIARISAAEIEGAVMAQVRGLLRQPEVVLGAWRAARSAAPDLTEDKARLALERLDPLWEELFPAEQARIIRVLVDRVDIGVGGADVRLRLEGLASLARDLAAPPAEAARVAA
ncbi:site-specific recombinase [Falsiroseomonas selenitidurans]|uniref:Site-specific recombinase n=1 Tax=Falsiroseomonas selenitidurans TaxID=2716335 RepID=A0ABX1EAX5_9PROT|nr:site-specific recombinase [Falsiroseomonas selenitidurans]NKC34344.1 site-specific recombinase [Falsiroseomonas selenitidurans]